MYKVIIGSKTRLVNPELGVCTCNYGMQGGFCKHLSVITKQIAAEKNWHYKLEQDHRKTLFFLATGIIVLKYKWCDLFKYQFIRLIVAILLYLNAYILFVVLSL